MISKKNKALLKKQHYAIVGKHSAVQICRWTKKSLIGEGVCYKQKFYGIKSHRCCQISPSAVWCQNKCIHCWRAIEATQGSCMPKKVDKPQDIIKECLFAQRKMLTGFGGNAKVNEKKFAEAQEPTQFAISLIGETTLYPYLGELVEKLRKKGKSTFIVTNGLQPSLIKKMAEKRQLPTQLYISLNTPNKWLYSKWHNSKDKQAWKKFNQSLELMKKIKSKTRTVLRMTLVKGLNMEPEFIKEYASLIKKALPDFLEIKGYKSVGFARRRLGWNSMPTHKEIKDYSRLITKAIGYQFEDDFEPSCVVLLKRDDSVKRFIS
jgi:tRNA wybutosine-synthesizing protein 1